MKVFVWESADKVSDSYHCGGGIVVFAENEDRARELVNSSPGCALKPEEKPDEVRDCAGDTERVLIMPDAGCC